MPRGRLLDLCNDGCGVVLLYGTSAPFADIILFVPVVGHKRPCRTSQTLGRFLLFAHALRWQRG